MKRGNLSSDRPRTFWRRLPRATPEALRAAYEADPGDQRLWGAYCAALHAQRAPKRPRRAPSARLQGKDPVRNPLEVGNSHLQDVAACAPAPGWTHPEDELGESGAPESAGDPGE